jgi:hypothetical protein
MRAIETGYRGHRFRSRTEARWAVFLDSLGRRDWQYEREGYDLPSGRYLPDFWLPIRHPVHQHAGYWLEIKGDQPTEAEKRSCLELHEETRHHVILIAGQPQPGKFSTYKSVCGFPRVRDADGDAPADDPLDRTRMARMDSHWPHEGIVYSGFSYAWHCSAREEDGPPIGEAEVLAALRAATEARFEFGETPGV